MSTLPENRTINDSAADHVADHNELARLHNILDQLDASEVIAAPAGGLVTGTAQEQLYELDTRVTEHTTETIDAHDASAVSFAPYGEITETDTQGAIENLEDRLNATAFIDDLDVAVTIKEHFLGGDRTSGYIGENGWMLAVGTTGALADLGSIIDGTAGRISPSTGADAGGYAEVQLRSGSTTAIHLHGAPPFTFEWKVRIPVLPTAAQDFNATFGLCNMSTTADPTNGFWFLLQPFATDSTPTWQCVVADVDTGATTTDSTVAVAALTDYKLRVTCDGAGTAYFYIDGVVVHTQTSSTNFPDQGAANNGYAPTAKVRKTVGTTARTIQCDYFGMRYEYT